MLSPETCEQVVANLAKYYGIEAFYEYPGYVSVPLPDASRFNLSDCEGNLSIQHAEADGEVMEEDMDSTIPSDSMDAARIAEFLGTCYRQATLPQFVREKASAEQQREKFNKAIGLLLEVSRDWDESQIAGYALSRSFDEEVHRLQFGIRFAVAQEVSRG